MKVILKQDIKKVGQKGEIVEVSDGYGRNYLLPKGLALPADQKNLNVAIAQAKSAERKKLQAADEAKLMAAQLEKLTITIPVRIGEGGKLFGSVTGKDVSDALKAQNIDIDKRKISLNSDVTGVGTYEATLKLHPEITSTITINIVAK